MTTRSIIVAIVAGLLGFCVGTLVGPVDLRTASQIEVDNARLRKEVQLYKAELAEINAVLKGGK